jgi:hypothetical protein
MLVAAVNWPAGRNWSREHIMANPSLAHDVTGWMRPDDFGVVAIDPVGRLVGAAWLRYLTGADAGFGHASDESSASAWRSRTGAAVWAERSCAPRSRPHKRAGRGRSH